MKYLIFKRRKEGEREKERKKGRRGEEKGGEGRKGKEETKKERNLMGRREPAAAGIGAFV
jgi:hypothetical protein